MSPPKAFSVAIQRAPLSVAGVPKELLGPDIQAAVLREARVLLEQAQATCRQLLKANRAQLDTLAQRLLEREVISGDELKGLLGARVSEGFASVQTA